MSLRVTSLTLTNFRSYKQAGFSFSDQTVFVGANASGKTNLLEALYLLASTKSFRADREIEMIHWGETQARLAGTIERGDRTHSMVAKLQAGSRTISKTFEIDNTKRKARELATTFPMALFSADDVRLVDGAPGRRRRAFDLALSQSSLHYRDALNRYTKVVASRNRLLEQISSGEATSGELDFWDGQLIESGQAIIDGRHAFAEYLNLELEGIYESLIRYSPDKITGAAGPLELAYEPLSIDLSVDIPRRRQADLAVGTTTVGPHRDDWKLLLGRRPLSSFGSGGEYRSAMLAFRISEAAWLCEKLAVRPVLLLDDVFSELDEHRRTALLEHLTAGQVIITTPEADVLPKEFANSAQIINIAEARRV